MADIIAIDTNGKRYRIEPYTKEDLYAANNVYNARERSSEYDTHDLDKIKIIQLALEQGYHKLIPLEEA